MPQARKCPCRPQTNPGILQTTHPVTCFRAPQSRAEPQPEEHVRFYAAAVILGLEYMQNHDLVWR